MKMLRKTTAWKSTENYHGQIYNGVYLNLLGTVKCTDNNSPINRLHHRFFSEYMYQILTF